MIHRGLEQIGGCITEIESASGTRIFIDLGHNLPSAAGDKDPKADAAVIERLTDGVSAIFYTHYHGDHIGLFHLVPDEIPQYLGEKAKQITLLKYERLASKPDVTGVTAEFVGKVKRLNTYQATKAFQVGDITIRPYFVSHSAADAYMFVVEADGKRVLHTGDFRCHSVLGKELLPTIEKYILDRKQPIDVLIIEGTMLGRSSEKVLTENELSDQMASIIGRYKNVFIQCSSTDIERLSSIYYAHRKMKRPLLCDYYQKSIIKEFDYLDENKFYVYPYKNNPKLDKWIADKGFTMIIRTSDTYAEWVDEMLRRCDPHQTALIYSQWRGYLNPSHTAHNAQMARFIYKFQNIHFLHTSGHAKAEDLAAVCRTVNPTTALIPIHKEKSADLASLGLPNDLCNKIHTDETLYLP